MNSYFIDSPSFQAPVRCAPGNVLVEFDSHRTVTFEEGGMHTIVFGTTGAGKTTALILSILQNLIAAGFAGLLVDIKGNMTKRLRALCTYFKRYDDVVELGVGPEATRFNFLANLDNAAVYEFFDKLTFKCVGPGHNTAFYKAGVRVATDLVKLCRFMAFRDGRYTPTLETILELMTNFPLAAELFKVFEFLAESFEEKRLAKQIRNNCFHPCLWTPYDSNNRSENYDDQANYQTRATTNPLKALLQSPGIKHGFCSAEDGALDIENLIYNKKKIVTLRFGSRSGSAGEDLTRFCLSEYYKAVFVRGLGLDVGEKTFLVMDEFQDFADFGSFNALNDNAFVAKSREFNNIFVAASQSVSALITRGFLPAKIESFINNCNNRIFMYCDDPWTQEVSRRHSIVSLTKLGPGEAVTVKFNIALRQHECGLDTLQNAHDECQARLSAGEALGPLYADEIAKKAIKSEAEDPESTFPLEEALLEMNEEIELTSPESEKNKKNEAKKRQEESRRETMQALASSEMREHLSGYPRRLPRTMDSHWDEDDEIIKKDTSGPLRWTVPIDTELAWKKDPRKK